MRTSAAVRLDDPAAPGAAPRTLLIDTTPELRLQAVTYGVDRADAVFFTHGHADHVMGFDELRRFCELQGAALPVYAAPQVLDRLAEVFGYALTDAASGVAGIPIVTWHAFTEPVTLWGHRLTPVALEHGIYPSWGLRIDAPDGGSMAWCPDCHGLSPASAAALADLDVLFLDGLRHRPHPTHFTVAEALDVLRRLAPRRAWLIHMTHDLDHGPPEAALPRLSEVPGGVRLAYDGLEVPIGPRAPHA